MVEGKGGGGVGTEARKREVAGQVRPRKEGGKGTWQETQSPLAFPVPISH